METIILKGKLSGFNKPASQCKFFLFLSTFHKFEDWTLALSHSGRQLLSPSDLTILSALYISIQRQYTGDTSVRFNQTVEGVSTLRNLCLKCITLTCCGEPRSPEAWFWNAGWCWGHIREKSWPGLLTCKDRNQQSACLKTWPIPKKKI